MDKKKYRWVICAGCTLMFFCTAGLGMTGFTVYQPYLISDGGLTNAQASLLTSIRSMFTFLTMFAVARILNKTDIRLGGSLSVLSIAGALLLYGAADSFPVYAAAAAVAGIGYGVGGMLAVSVMMHRWFEEHEGLAVGICSAGSGFSAVLGTPVIVWMIETFSLKQAFFMEAGFVAVLAVIVFLMLRNRPKGEERPPQFVSKAAKEHPDENRYLIGTREKYFVLAGILLMGFSYAATSHISVLYRNAGYPAGQVSLIVSAMGAALFVGKCVYGEAADRLGSFRSGNIFFGMLVSGSAICCLAGIHNMALALAATLLVSCGSVLLSVGITIIANSVARQKYYALVVRRFQIIYMLGSMAYGVVPGIIADHTGTYIPAYILITFFAAGAMLLIQPVLRGREKAEAEKA